MIKLALVGYGKMGKEIESILDSNEFALSGKYDIDNNIQSNLTPLPDVAIEFSTPKSIIENIEYLSSRKINIVCGTTGWYDKINEVKNIIESNDTGFIYASNFSVGVNIFFQVVRYTSEIMNRYSQYNIGIEETHHTTKLDKPSGTALRMAEYVVGDIQRKKQITNDKSDLSPQDLNIISKRIANVVGNHKVTFESASDKIILEHDAKSRRGFAEGALIAAKFIHGKKGFYKFEEIFGKLI